MPLTIEPIVTQPDGERGFNVFGAATSDPPFVFGKPGYFQGLSAVAEDGDFLVIKYQPYGAEGREPNRGRKYVYMLHRDGRGEISLTKLFEIPHDRAMARCLARKVRLLLDCVPDPEADGEDAAPDPPHQDSVLMTAPDEIRSPTEASQRLGAWQRAQARAHKAARDGEDAEAEAALRAEQAHEAAG